MEGAKYGKSVYLTKHCYYFKILVTYKEMVIVFTIYSNNLKSIKCYIKQYNYTYSYFNMAFKIKNNFMIIEWYNNIH